ncbi:metallopeptidase TldD-related protein [Streptomyces sp. NPDC000941]
MSRQGDAHTGRADSALSHAVQEIRAAASSRVQSWELVALDRRETVAEVASGEPDVVRSGQELTACLRLVVDGRLGTATTTRPTRVAELINAALECAAFGPPVPALADPPHLPHTGRTHHTEHLPDEEIVAGTRALADQLAGLQRRTGLLLHGAISRVDETVHVATEHGGTVETTGRWAVSGVAEAQQVGRLQMSWTSWTRAPSVPGQVADWLSQAGGWQELPHESWPSGPQPMVLLAPHAVHTLLSPLVSSLSGTAVAMGRSFVTDQPGGERLLDPRVSLLDGTYGTDGYEAGGADGLPCPSVDDEGVLCSPLTLIEGGAPCGRYHTRQSAAATGNTRPTGHGFRGNALRRKPAQPVSAVLNNAYLHAERELLAPAAGLLAAMDHGVVIESLLGGVQKGRLSPVVEARVRQGFVVRHGHVVARLRGGVLRMDLRDALGSGLAGVSNEVWPVSRMWTGRLPFVLTSDRSDRGSGFRRTT